MDKRFYEQAAIELANGVVDTALMAKAIALSQGDDARTNATYLTIRAEEIRSEERKASLGKAATLAGTGAVIVGNAAATATTRAIPILIKVLKFIFWAIVVLLLVGFLINRVVNNSIRSEYPELAGGGNPPPSSSPSPASTGHALGRTLDQQNQQFDEMLEQLERSYAPLNPHSSRFDRQAVVALEARIRMYEQRGLSGPHALQRSAADIADVSLLIPPAIEPVATSEVSAQPHRAPVASSSSASIDYSDPHNERCWRTFQSTIAGIPESTPLARYAELEGQANRTLAACVRK